MNKILIRSSWQSVNIGDIGHTPGLLALLERVKPEWEVTLWPCDIGNGVEAMLRRRFPRLRIVEGDADSEPVLEALRTHDMFLHGSGPSVVRFMDIELWRRHNHGPYRIYGVTVETLNPGLKEILDHAWSIHCRDTVSLNVLIRENVRCPRIAFGPDATFAIDLRNDGLAAAYLERNRLEDKKFCCFIPRLRYTPYYKIHGWTPGAEDLRRAAVSDEFRDSDHAKQLEALIDVLDKSSQKVLICPEMTYEVELGREMLFDRLPERYRSRVCWRDSYWTPDEAASVYARASCVVSFEMHSPIIAFANGTPAIYLRQPTDTCKGQMWRDIGLRDWIFEIDECVDGHGIGDRTLEIINNQDMTTALMARARSFVDNAMTSAFA